MATNLVKFNVAEIEAISAIAKRTAVQNPKNSTVDIDFKDVYYMRPVIKFYKYDNNEVAIRREVTDTSYLSDHWNAMEEFNKIVRIDDQLHYEDFERWAKAKGKKFRRKTALIGYKFNLKRTNGKSWKFNNLNQALEYFEKYLVRSKIASVL